MSPVETNIANISSPFRTTDALSIDQTGPRNPSMTAATRRHARISIVGNTTIAFEIISIWIQPISPSCMRSQTEAKCLPMGVTSTCIEKRTINLSCAGMTAPMSIKEAPEYLHVRHSQLNGGWLPVWCAGELSIKDGRLWRLNNESGHFKPPTTCLPNVERTFLAYGYRKASDFASGAFSQVRATEVCAANPNPAPGPDDHDEL
jgi:hypothetical protein